MHILCLTQKYYHLHESSYRGTMYLAQKKYFEIYYIKYIYIHKVVCFSILEKPKGEFGKTYMSTNNGMFN